MKKTLRTAGQQSAVHDRSAASSDTSIADANADVNGFVNALLMDAADLTEAEWKQTPAEALEENKNRALMDILGLF